MSVTHDAFAAVFAGSVLMSVASFSIPHPQIFLSHIVMACGEGQVEVEGSAWWIGGGGHAEKWLQPLIESLSLPPGKRLAFARKTHMVE